MKLTPAFLVLVVLIPMSLMIWVFLSWIIQGSSCETVEFSNDSDCGLLEGESIDLFLQEHEAAWQDATSSTTTESHTVTTTAAHNDVTAASLDPPHPIDHQMICDIKTIASRLASKAHQLLGV